MNLDGLDSHTAMVLVQLRDIVVSDYAEYRKTIYQPDVMKAIDDKHTDSLKDIQEQVNERVQQRLNIQKEFNSKFQDVFEKLEGVNNT